MVRSVVAVCICILLAACGGGTSGDMSSSVGNGPGTAPLTGDGGGGPSQAGMGTLRVSLTDAPSETFEEINITVAGVRVHMSADAGEAEAGWHDLEMAGEVPINLLSLQDGLLLQLGLMPLEAGHYQQIRLVLAPNTGDQPPFNNSVVTGTGEDAVESALEVPKEVKLVHQFRVDEGKTVDLILDLDGKKSVVSTGNGKHKLKPVIKATVKDSQ